MALILVEVGRLLMRPQLLVPAFVSGRLLRATALSIRGQVFKAQMTLALLTSALLTQIIV
jgi:hypothetical protein